MQFDYVRFEDDGRIGKNYAHRSQAITRFVKRAREAIPSDIKFSLDVYGRTLWEWNSENKDPVGQNLDQLQPYVDYLSPMIYPSHYSSPNFVNNPSYCISKSLKSGHRRLSVKIRPFIQGFNRSVPPEMNMEEYIRAQLSSVRESQANGFLVWNPKSNYDHLWKVFKREQH